MQVHGAPFTTYHSQVLYPFQAQRGLPPVGPVIGIDDLAGGTKFSYDCWSLYERRLLTGPNMLVLGQIGKGKSAFVKTYVGRQILWGGRRAFVLDPKAEYGPFSEFYGVPILRLVPGGTGGRLNPLDSLGTDDADATVRRVALVNALVATNLGRELSPIEAATLGAIVEWVVDHGRRTGREPTLGDVVHAAFSVPADIASALHTTADHLATEIRAAAVALQRLLRGEFAGMLDGPTSVPSSWRERGLVVDLSAVYQTDALAPVMVATATWLRQAAGADPRPTLIVLDEAWAVLRLRTVTRWLQATAKLSRSFGVSLVLVVHRISDLEAQGDSGAENVKQAVGFLADTETRVLFAQPESEADTLQRVLGLTSTEVECVLRLPPYRSLWRVGSQAAVVRHVLSPLERQMVGTDAVMQQAVRERAGWKVGATGAADLTTHFGAAG
jgi:type IV secretory pathway VirB4 component